VERRDSVVSPDRRDSTVTPDRRGSTVLDGSPSVPEYASSSLLSPEDRRLSAVTEEKDKPLTPMKLDLQREDSEVFSLSLSFSSSAFVFL